MRAILSSQFWNEEIESARTLDAVVRSAPNEPPPLGIQPGSKLSRSQQLQLFQRIYAVPCTPAYVPIHDRGGGGWVVDRVIHTVGRKEWWASLTARLKLQQMLLPRNQRGGRTPFNAAHPPQPTSPQGGSEPWAGGLLDPSMYALAANGRYIVGPTTLLAANVQLDSVEGLLSGGGGKGRNLPWSGRLSLRQKLPGADARVEASWQEQWMDRSANYWEVPYSLSLDVANRGAPGGVRYRVGVLHSPRAAQGGHPYSLTAGKSRVGICGIVGALVSANLDHFHRDPPPSAALPFLSSNLFASVGVTAQLGQFRKRFADHTLVDLRLDGRAKGGGGYPTLSLSGRQQIWGPVRARFDTRLALDTSGCSALPRQLDTVVGWDLGLPQSLGVAKLVGWFSPSRREAMIEFKFPER